MDDALIVRDKALDELRRKARGVIDELSQLLSDDDPRWYAFGLNPPAAPETPEAIDDLVLTHGAPGMVLANWTNPPRAKRYRVLKQIVGVDSEMVSLDSTTETQFVFAGLTAGQTLRVQVIAVNDAGASPASEIVEIVVA